MAVIATFDSGELHPKEVPWLTLQQMLNLEYPLKVVTHQTEKFADEAEEAEAVYLSFVLP